MKRLGFIFFLSSLFFVISGCASAPPPEHVGQYTSPTGENAAAVAISMVGRPYKFKGDTPEGFDCSGLVRYSYQAAGLELPHGTTQLRKLSHPVALTTLHKGDLLFFNEEGKKYSHVGIYEGDGRFVHAPSSGKSVRIDSLEDRYWKEHLLEARRLK